MKYYGIPGTSEWIEAARMSQAMKERGYIEIVSQPPKLSLDSIASGKICVLTTFGEWDIVDDPNYIDKMDTFIKKIFNTNVISKSMYERLAQKLLEIAKEK
jgi:hypothetical protein